MKSVALLVAAYITLTYLPWYLLPLGWVFVGTTLAGVRLFQIAAGGKYLIFFFFSAASCRLRLPKQQFLQ